MMVGEAVEVMDTARPRVLVVNDRESQRVAIRATLTSLGVDVVEVDSGRAALRAIFAQAFAVILMDVQMPSMNGYETADLIRQRPSSSRTPIIFITAHRGEDQEALTAYASGGVDFIFTPVVPDVLRAKVSVFVALFVQAQELQRSLDSITALNNALNEHQSRMEIVLDNVADGIVTAGEGGVIESFNPSARALFGYREDEVIGQPVTVMIAPAWRDRFRGMWDNPPEPLAHGGKAIETIGYRRDGSTFAIEVEHSEVTLGDRVLTLAFVRNVAERVARIEDLEHRALHDDLTGLANRTLFGEHAVQTFASATRGDMSQAVLVMDLDGFKHVNESFGHDHGDELLRQVAERLMGALRDTDVIARLGGDEFAILPSRGTDLATAVAVAWKVRQACQPEFVVHDKVVRVSASVGIAMFPKHGTTTAELLVHADAAMYVAKKSGSGHAAYDTEQETQAARQLALLADLRQCIARDELVLHYQPKIDLATRAISGVEALVRWQHPVHGLLSPIRFMPEVERTELIDPVTGWVLNEAMRQQVVWRQAGIHLTIAVNISAHSLRPNSNLPEIVAELTRTWGTVATTLTLELTEGALIEADAPETLARLHEMGPRIAIDDFGTGYSSLAYLHGLPVDELKIDQSFVMRLSADSGSAVIVRSTIDLAHNLGLTVVAEGVEDQAAMDLLVEYGCDSVQGYFLGHPGPADSLATWLADSPYGTRALSTVRGQRALGLMADD
jgi:diguanylate cyclase (GGDEF)-like protein/PAS domain S-box-containing protein